MKKLAVVFALCLISFNASGTPLSQNAFCEAVGDLTYRAVESVRNSTIDTTLLNIHAWVVKQRKSGILENDTEIFLVGYSVGAAYVSAKAFPNISPAQYRQDYINMCQAGKTF